MKNFALVGNPNCGKTTLFNVLTGSTAHVGNWPGVTVDKKEGTYKRADEKVNIVDLPGIYSLSPYTPEEVIARNYILDEETDCVINVVDATNLERNLYLTTQIMEIDVPMIIALNMMDAVRKAGDKIDALELQDRLGIPVVEISALKGDGIHELMEKACAVCKNKRKGRTVLEGSALKHLIGDVTIALTAQGVENPLFHAIKLVEQDELEVEAHKDIVKMVDEFKNTFDDKVFGNDFEAIIADGRYAYISKYYSVTMTRKHKDEFRMTTSDKADRVLTHKIWGIPIFLVILLSVFHLTFSENFLFLGALLNPEWVSFSGTAFEGLIGSGAGIASPGVMLFNLMDIITANLFGWISGLVQGWGASPAVLSLVSDGIFSGLASILSFVPQIVFLLLLISILEDTGYMARVAFMLDKILRKFGVSGRAFIPMIMGFGCSVPAIINTRTLIDERERTLTIRVIPFFTCGAKVPILTAIAGAIVQSSPIGSADLITYAMYVLGMAVAVITIILMRSTTQRGPIAPFIMELPAYHAPSPKALALHMWDKIKHYLQKAFTVILASTIVIWFLSNFGWNWQMAESIDESILASIGTLCQPLFTPLGFGAQLSSFGWMFIVAAVTGLIAKENVIATFGALAAVLVAGFEGGEDGTGAVMVLMSATGITWQALIAFIVFNMTTIPCFASVATAKGELGKGKTKWTILFWFITSYIVGTITYVVLTWWWTAFIVLALIVLTILAVKLYNKKHPVRV